jgi:hypothetical protein
VGIVHHFRIESQRAQVDPYPPNGSSTKSTRRLLLRIARSIKLTGFIVGCSRLLLGFAICHTSP